MRYFLLFLLFASPLAAQQWQPVDYALASAASGLLVADWSQTRVIGRDPCYCEGNLLLGPHPATGRVNTYFSIALALNVAAFALPERPRRIWYGAVILTEAAFVLTNIRHAR